MFWFYIVISALIITFCLHLLVFNRLEGGLLRRLMFVGLVMVFSVGGYFYLSDWQQVKLFNEKQARIEHTLENSLLTGKPLTTAFKDNLLDYVLVLQKKLQRNHKSAKGWYFLALSYMQLGDFDNAEKAIMRAYSLDPKSIDSTLAYARLLILKNENRLDQKSLKLLVQVLQQNPQHEGAMLLLGMSAYAAGLYDITLEAWQNLLKLRPPGSDGAKLLQKNIEQVKLAMAGKQSNQTAVNQTAQGLLTVTIALDKALQHNLKPENTVFLLAKKTDVAGPPVAAKKLMVRQFPITLTLSDADQMIKGKSLKTYESLKVIARVSGNGEPFAKPGDLQGEAVVKLSEAETVNVVIDQQL